MEDLANDAPWHRALAPLRRPIAGVEWQPGAVMIPLKDVDVLIVCGAPRCISTLILLIKARLMNVPTVWWGHFWSSSSKAWRFEVRCALMRLANAVLFYTDQEVSEYRSRRRRSAIQPVSAINNGVNVSAIAPFRAEYVASTRPKALLFIGRLTSKANVSILLEALVHPRLAEVTLHVIGDGEELTCLKSEADRLGLGNRVVWHGARTDEAEIANVANSCRIFVYPGEVGLSLIHAMAYGLPAIVHSNRWRHMPEIAAFKDGATGKAFYPGDAVSLAETISMSMDSHCELEAASRDAIQLADRVFNTDRMVDRTVAIVDLVRQEQGRR